MSWNAREDDFKAAVETLSNVEEVEVTRATWTDEAGFDFYHWTVRAFFLSMLRSCFSWLILCY